MNGEGLRLMYVIYPTSIRKPLKGSRSLTDLQRYFGIFLNPNTELRNEFNRLTRYCQRYRNLT